MPEHRSTTASCRVNGDRLWSRLMAMAEIGATYQTSAFLSCFITLIIAHSFHVLTGIVWVAILAVQVLQHGLNPANERRAVCFSMFWNFIDITWVCVFIFVYLMGVLR